MHLRLRSIDKFILIGRFLLNAIISSSLDRDLAYYSASGKTVYCGPTKIECVPIRGLGNYS